MAKAALGPPGVKGEPGALEKRRGGRVQTDLAVPPLAPPKSGHRYKLIHTHTRHGTHLPPAVRTLGSRIWSEVMIVY